MKNKFYITTTLPYVNAEPHIGFALEIIQADVIARYHTLVGDSVVFNFGTDEHGLKIYRKAVEQGKDPQTYCDEYAAKFDALKQALNLSYSHFIRTTDPHHILAAQEFWKLCNENGDIYKKTYKVKYCVGCELEKTDSELVDGRCPLHPKQDIELLEEENYFFKFSKYQRPLLDFYEAHPDFVKPEGKFNEIKAFVEGGLEDFSVSRLKAKMPWGIDVPGDSEHVMYVWFDALINYISTLGWPEDKQNFADYWPGLQVAGKDNLRQQTAIWQAMLMSAGQPNSKQVFIHGFLTINGQKISKSLGNAINPIEFANKYGTDALRYFLLAKIHPWEDSDFSEEKFVDAYNSDLANGLGNLVARVAKLCENENITMSAIQKTVAGKENKLVLWIAEPTLENKYIVAIDQFNFSEALQIVWHQISELDGKIERVRPWDKDLDRKEEIVKFLRDDAILTIRDIARLLQPFLPETAEKILKQFEGPSISSQIPLFPRIK